METFISPERCTTVVDSRIGGRAENQDCAIAPDTPYGTLVVVCDGMGGGKAGASASTTVVQAMAQYVRQAQPGQPAEQVLTQAVMHAHGLLRQTVCQRPELLGMGTTCVAALLTSTQAAIVHVGDSRCYLMRAGSVVFRTADHSVVGEMVRKGELTEDDARRAANANVITRALGVADRLEPEANLVDLCPALRSAPMDSGMPIPRPNCSNCWLPRSRSRPSCPLSWTVPSSVPFCGAMSTTTTSPSRSFSSKVQLPLQCNKLPLQCNRISLQCNRRSLRRNKVPSCRNSVPMSISSTRLLRLWFPEPINPLFRRSSRHSPRASRQVVVAAFSSCWQPLCWPCP